MGQGRVMDRCGNCVRIFMFVSNFIIWVGSILLLVLGVWTVVDKPFLEELLGSRVYATAAYIIIGVGVIAFFVSFLGCFGALKEIKCMLILYFVITLLLFIVLLVGGVLGYVFRGQAQETVKTTLTQQMRAYDPGNSGAKVTRAWDDTQIALKCCGIDKPEDWISYNSRFQVSGPKVPRSCCKPDDNDGKISNCDNNPTPSNSYTRGCYHEARSFVEHYGLVIGGVGVVIALLMLLGLIFSVVLFMMIN